MFEKLPDLLDPIYCAEHNRQFQAHLKQSAMPRLCEQVAEPNGDVWVEMAFRWHKGLKGPQFELSVKSELKLTCQRTLDVFVFPVEATVRGVYVPSMALAEDWEEDIEIYEWPDEKISVLDLVEDELLLAIPMVPRKDFEHVTDESFSAEVGEREEEAFDSERPNPFAALAQLKQTN
jgi:uncharacterized protein